MGKGYDASGCDHLCPLPFALTTFPLYTSPTMHAFAILGSHPTLSLAEIAVVTDQRPSHTHNDVAIYENLDGNLIALCDRLGGTQKVGVIIGSVAAWNHDELATFLTSDLITESAEGKIEFGISVYDGGDSKITENARRSAQGLGIEVKNRIKAQERSARYVISKAPTLSSVVVRKNHLIDRGAEFVFIITREEILIGKTVAVQNVDAWSERDFGRPRRNAKQGMLPPKLARMMVNLTGIDVASSTIFDPFCGSGTILMEAALLGAQALVGSDINGEATSDTEANLRWLQQVGAGKLPPFKLFPKSAQTVAEDVVPNSIDAVVTETYLGRPRRGNETRQEVEDAVAYVANLYRESFSALLPTLKTGATLIIAAPVHHIEGRDVAFDARTLLEPLGYTHSPLPYEPIVYHHKEQLVGRRIWRFIKN